MIPLSPSLEANLGVLNLTLKTIGSELALRHYLEQ